jgi:hypothetical protein
MIEYRYSCTRMCCVLLLLLLLLSASLDLSTIDSTGTYSCTAVQLYEYDSAICKLVGSQPLQGDVLSVTTG